jgi:hypothetical protein
MCGVEMSRPLFKSAAKNDNGFADAAYTRL